mgnify:FL=1
MKIGELARAVGLTAITIRYYESMGLLPRPGRTSSNYRVYSAEHVERLQFVTKAKRLGLSLEEIKGILQLHARQEATCGHVRALLEAKLQQVDALVGELVEFRRELALLKDAAGTMEDCRPSGSYVCGIIERGEVGVSVQALTWLEATHRSQPSQPEGRTGARRRREQYA